MTCSDHCSAAGELGKAVAGIDAKLDMLLKRGTEEREEFREDMRELKAWRQTDDNRITKIESDVTKLATTIDGSERQADIGLIKRVVALENSQTSTRAVMSFVKGLAIAYVPIAGLIAGLIGWVSSIVAHPVSGK